MLLLESEGVPSRESVRCTPEFGSVSWLVRSRGDSVLEVWSPDLGSPSFRFFRLTPSVSGMSLVRSIRNFSSQSYGTLLNQIRDPVCSTIRLEGPCHYCRSLFTSWCQLTVLHVGETIQNESRVMKSSLLQNSTDLAHTRLSHASHMTHYKINHEYNMHNSQSPFMLASV